MTQNGEDALKPGEGAVSHGRTCKGARLGQTAMAKSRTGEARLGKGRRTRTSAIYSAASDIGLLAAVLVGAVPIGWLVYSSLRFSRDIIASNPIGHPGALTLSNYAAAFGQGSALPRQLANSVIIVACATGIALCIGSLAGYSLSKLGWRRSTVNVILAVAALAQILPPVTLLPGFYVTLKQLGLLGTVGGLVVVDAVMNMPFAVILMKVYFDTIPPELREAARTDGASEARIMWRVMAPLAAPGMATTAILVGIFVWNDFLMGLTLSGGGTSAPITVGIADLLQPYSIQFGQMAAAASVAAIPMMLLALFAGRYVVSGLTRGALK